MKCHYLPIKNGDFIWNILKIHLNIKSTGDILLINIFVLNIWRLIKIKAYE